MYSELWSFGSFLVEACICHGGVPGTENDISLTDNLLMLLLFLLSFGVRLLSWIRISWITSRSQSTTVQSYKKS